MGKNKKDEPPEPSAPKADKSSKWDIFKAKAGKTFKGFLKWGLIIAPAFIPGSAVFGPLAQILSKFLDEKLNIELDSAALEKRLSDRPESLSKKALMDEVFKFLKEEKKGSLSKSKEIEIEKTLATLNSTVQEIYQFQQKNPQDLPEIYTGLIEEIRQSNVGLAQIVQQLQNSQENLIAQFSAQFTATMENFMDNISHASWAFQNDTLNALTEFTEDELILYCRTQLEIDDLSSRFGNPFDEDKYLVFPKLDREFDRFIEDLKNPNERRRIFLLLGHMGLGKTWNSCHLAYKALDLNYPTFFFHLGRNFESKFENLFGPLNLPKRLRELSQRLQAETSDFTQKQILLVFDGFDELTPYERNEKILPLLNLIRNQEEKSTNNIMILLTSRRVDWGTTTKVNELSNTISNFIYTTPFSHPPVNVFLPTKVSWVLEDVTDEKLLEDICAKYGVDYLRIQDEKIQKIIQKPFILNIITEKDPTLIYSSFDANNPDWFDIFVSSDNSASILRRMGIYGDIENFFQKIVAFIGDPYHSVREEFLAPIYKENEFAWQVIYSSGIITKSRDILQNVYSIPPEFQTFVDLYLLKLRGTFQNLEMCKSDAEALLSIQQELNLGHLVNYTESPETDMNFGFVLGKHDEVIELYITNREGQIKYLPGGVIKLIHLQKLRLANNELRNIPRSLDRLSFLKELDVSHNLINRLPKTIGDLKSMEYLDLSHNMIPEFPDSFFDLTHLKTLHFETNPITRIPQLWNQLESLSTVQMGDHIDVFSSSYTIESIDNDIPFQATFTTIQNKKFRLKDGAIIDYLTFLKKQEQIKDFKYKIDKKQGNITTLSIVLINPTEFSTLLWDIEDCYQVEFANFSPQFAQNHSIHELILYEETPNPKRLIEIDKSLPCLKELKKIHIKLYQDISLPATFNQCEKMYLLYIQSTDLVKTPENLFENPHLSNCLIFDESRKIPDWPHSLVIQLTDNYNSFEVTDFYIPAHIQTFIIGLRKVYINNLAIEGEVNTLLLTNNQANPYQDFQSIHQSKLSVDQRIIVFHLREINPFPHFKTFHLDSSRLSRVFISGNTFTQIPYYLTDLPQISKIAIKDFGNRNFPITEILEFPDHSFIINSRSLQIIPNDFGITSTFNQIYILQPSLTTIPPSFLKSTEIHQIVVSQDLISEKLEDSQILSKKHECEIICSPYANFPEELPITPSLESLIFFKIELLNLPKLSGNLHNLLKLQVLGISPKTSPRIFENMSNLSAYVQIVASNYSFSEKKLLDQRESEAQIQINLFDSGQYTYFKLPAFQEMKIEFLKFDRKNIGFFNDGVITHLYFQNVRYRFDLNFLFSRLPRLSLFITNISLADVNRTILKSPIPYHYIISNAPTEIFEQIYYDRTRNFPVAILIVDISPIKETFQNILEKDAQVVLIDSKLHTPRKIIPEDIKMKSMTFDLQNHSDHEKFVKSLSDSSKRNIVEFTFTNDSES